MASSTASWLHALYLYQVTARGPAPPIASHLCSKTAGLEVEWKESCGARSGYWLSDKMPPLKSNSLSSPHHRKDHLCQRLNQISLLDPSLHHLWERGRDMSVCMHVKHRCVTEHICDLWPPVCVRPMCAQMCVYLSVYAHSACVCVYTCARVCSSDVCAVRACTCACLQVSVGHVCVCVNSRLRSLMVVMMKCVC